MGFPPSFADPELEVVTSESEPTSTFLRIGGIHMMGDISLTIHSRPLDQQLGEAIVFDLRKLEAMNDQIRKAARRAGPRGTNWEARSDMTSTELGIIIRDYCTSTAK